MSYFRSCNHQNCTHCVGRDGRPKRAYPSEATAEEAATYIERTRRVQLRVYECEHTWSRHLTSDVSGGW